MAMFKVSDLMINVADARIKTRRGGTMLCLQVNPTVETCGRASPVMHIITITEQFQQFDKWLGRAIASRDTSDIEAVREVAEDLGRGVVAAGASGGNAMPGPDGDITDFPSPITPYVREVDAARLTASDLPLIKAQLHEALAVVEKLEGGLAPAQGVESEVVAEHLEAALKGLQR